MEPVEEVKAAIARGVDSLKESRGDEWVAFANFEWVLLAAIHDELVAQRPKQWHGGPR